MALVVGACSSEPSSQREATGVSSQAIVGGKDDYGDPAVGAVRYWFVDACTGTLIAPHTVLTAAHCTKTIAEKVGADYTLEVHFGLNSGDSKKADVKSHTEHPKYTKAGAGYDVAILTLESAIDDIPPVPIASGITPDLTGAMVRHVGFGDNQEDPKSGKTSGQGRKREATYEVHKVEPLLYWSGAGTLGQTCNGDSGGPMLWRLPSGQERIVAVVSDGPNCHDDGADARVDVDEVRNWILDQVKKNDPGVDVAPPMPSTATDAGTNDDGGDGDAAPDAPVDPPSAIDGGDHDPSASTPDAGDSTSNDAHASEDGAGANATESGCSVGAGAASRGTFEGIAFTLMAMLVARRKRTNA